MDDAETYLNHDGLEENVRKSKMDEWIDAMNQVQFKTSQINFFTISYSEGLQSKTHF